MQISRRRRSGGKYDASATAIFAAFTTPPTVARKALINSCVLALKAGGVWSLLDYMQVYAAADSQAALINWVTPGTFNGTVVNSPVFTADRDFTTNGTTSYVDSGFNASLGGTKFVRDSAYWGFWSRTAASTGGSVAGFFTGTDGNTRQPRTAGNETTGRINQAAATTSSTAGAQTDGSGLFGSARSGASATRFARNGVDIVTGAVASTALANGTLHYGHTGTAFAAMAFAASMAGQNLTTTQELALYNALQTYMTAVGA